MRVDELLWYLCHECGLSIPSTFLFPFRVFFLPISSFHRHEIAIHAIPPFSPPCPHLAGLSYISLRISRFFIGAPTTELFSREDPSLWIYVCSISYQLLEWILVHCANVLGAAANTNATVVRLLAMFDSVKSNENEALQFTLRVNSERSWDFRKKTNNPSIPQYTIHTDLMSRRFQI